MKFIDIKSELWTQPTNRLDGVYNHIAKCARVCYQSEKKSTSESDKEFVKRVILKHEDPIKNHGSVLEHGTIYLQIYDVWKNKKHIIDRYKNNKYSIVNYSFPSYYITTNLRVIYENDWWDDLDYMSEATKHHEKRYTVCIITDIGVSRELNRHRVNSISEESTRYCNYSKSKFDGISYAKLPWVNYEEYDKEFGIPSTYCGNFRPNEDDKLNYAIYTYFHALLKSEEAYLTLIDCGWTPQQARVVLPLNTKTQVVHTAFTKDWKHFIALRHKSVSGNVHPEMKVIANSINEVLKYKLI